MPLGIWGESLLVDGRQEHVSEVTMFNHNNKWLFGNVSLLDNPVSTVSTDRRSVENLCWRWGGGERRGEEVRFKKLFSASQSEIVGPCSNDFKH